MAESAAATRSGLPWEMRLGLSLPPFAYGGLTALLLIAGGLLYRLAIESTDSSGAGPGSHDLATRTSLVASLSIGYTLAAWRWIPTANSRDLVAGGLLPATAVADTTRQFVGDLGQIRRSRKAGLIGVAIFVGLIEVPSALAGGPPFDAWLSLHSFSYMLALGLLFFWITGRLVYFSLRGESPGAAVVEVDLLDQRPLRALGRIGMRSALAWVIGLSLGSLAFLNSELRFLQSLVVFVPVLLLTAGISLSTLLFPLRGLHRRIVEAKQAELLAVEAAIRGEAGSLAGTRIEGRGDLGLADLIAYKRLIEDVPSWPFDSQALARLGLYLLIPLASWVGGALVERGLGRILD